MTDISPNSLFTRRFISLRRPGIPKLEIGTTLAAMCRLLGDAFNMAYVEPYVRRPPPTRVFSEDDLEGRDPRW